MITRELFLTVRKDGRIEASAEPAMHILLEEDGTLAEYNKVYMTREGDAVVLTVGSLGAWGAGAFADQSDVWLTVEGTGEDARRKAMLPQWVGLMWRPL